MDHRSWPRWVWAAIATVTIQGCSESPNSNTFKEVASWGNGGLGDGEVYEPTALAVDPMTGELYVADFGDRSALIQVFNSQGEFVRRWTLKTSLIYGIVVVPDGTLFVTTGSYRSILHLTPDGRLIGSWNESGVSMPMGIAMGADGLLYVADRFQQRIQVFDAQGELKRSWTDTEGGNHLSSPMFIAVDPSGRVYVSDSDTHRIEVFDSEGRWQGGWGGEGFGPGQFSTVVALAVSAEGDILTAELFNRVQRFTPDGAFVSSWNGMGPGSLTYGIGFHNGPALAVDTERNAVYTVGVSDFGVQKYDEQGGFQERVGRRIASGPGELYHPLAIDVGMNGMILVSDANARLQWFTPQGSYQGGWPLQGDAGSIALAPDGTVFSQRLGRDLIQHHSQTGDLLGEWTSRPGSSLDVDEEGRVWTDDETYSRVLVFSPSGDLLKSWGKAGRGPGEFERVRGVAVEGGFVAVLDQHAIALFDEDGTFLHNIVSWSFLDWERAFWTVDIKEGKIYAISRDHKVSVFNLEGGRLGTLYVPESTSLTGSAADSDGNVYVLGYDASRVFRFQGSQGEEGSPTGPGQ